MWLHQPTGRGNVTGVPSGNPGVAYVAPDRSGTGAPPPERERNERFFRGSGHEKSVAERPAAGVFHSVVGARENPISRATERVSRREPSRPLRPRGGVRPGRDSKDSNFRLPTRKFRFRGLAARIPFERALQTANPISGVREVRNRAPSAAVGSAGGPAQSTIAFFANTTAWLNPAEIPIAPGDRDRQFRARRRNPGPNRKGDGRPRQVQTKKATPRQRSRPSSGVSRTWENPGASRPPH